jgi:hypothetical protein
VVLLVDLARLLVDTAGLPPAEGAVGRPLAFAVTHPDPGITLPVPARGRDLVALALWALLTSLVAWTLRGLAQRRRLASWPLFVPWLWLPVALGSVFLIRGAPSLSTPAIYPPQGRDLWLAAIPGLVFLMGSVCVIYRRFPDPAPAASSSSSSSSSSSRTAAAIAVAAWLPGALAALALLHACGAFNALVDASAGPPLSMRATPLASVLLAVEGGAAIVVAIGLPVLTNVARFRR